MYSSETKQDPDFIKAQQMCEEFAKREGRQPRIMIAKMGQDDTTAEPRLWPQVADCGFDVDMGPLFQTPAEAARNGCGRMTSISSECRRSPPATRLHPAGNRGAQETPAARTSS